MENIANIAVRIIGFTDKGNLNPGDFDIAEVKELISDFEALLFPSRADRESRPHISYEITEGSVNNIFRLPTAQVIMFSALMSAVATKGDIELLEKKQAAIIDKWQKKAYKTGRQYELRSSLSDTPFIVISQDTQFVVLQNEWVEASLNLYGKIYEEGGRKEINLHILTDRYGPLTVDATEEQLLAGENKLFKIYGIYAKGKQNVKTGELKDLKLIDFLPYSTKYDDLVLQKKIKRSTINWKKISNKDAWLSDLRGGENG